MITLKWPLIELVDYNTVYGGDNAQTAKKTTRRRGGSGKAKTAAPVAIAETAAPVAEEVVEAPVVDEASIVDETPVAEAPVAETAVKKHLLLMTKKHQLQITKKTQKKENKPPLNLPR